jgi:hypothetical protein
MRSLRLNDDASVGMMFYLAAALLSCLFIYILIGGVFDKVVDVHEVTSNLGDDFPVSDERVGTLNFLLLSMAAIPFLGIVLPLILYSVVISVRKGSGGL